MNLPNIGVSDPNHTNYPNQSAGGANKITPTSKEGTSYSGDQGYGFSVNSSDLKNPSVKTGTTLPIPSGIPILTYGDPNNTSSGEPSK